jgi:hypothetical protein
MARDGTEPARRQPFQGCILEPNQAFVQQFKLTRRRIQRPLESLLNESFAGRLTAKPSLMPVERSGQPDESVDPVRCRWPLFARSPISRTL